MSQNNLIKFCQLARTDEHIGHRLESLVSSETDIAINELISIASDQGLPFSRDDYFDYLISIQMSRLDS